MNSFSVKGDICILRDNCMGNVPLFLVNGSFHIQGFYFLWASHLLNTSESNVWNVWIDNPLWNIWCKLPLFPHSPTVTPSRKRVFETAVVFLFLSSYLALMNEIPDIEWHTIRCIIFILLFKLCIKFDSHCLECYRAQ